MAMPSHISYVYLLSNNPPAVIGVGGGASCHLPTLTPCSRKPAAEAEAETGWLAGWMAGWLDGWLVWETSRTRLGEPPPDVSQSWAGACWRGGGQKGAKVLKSAPLCTFSQLFAFWGPKCENHGIQLQNSFFAFLASKSSQIPLRI